MAKKIKVWLNNKLNKRLHCTVVMKFYDGKRSPHLKFWKFLGGGGRSSKTPPGMENPGGWRAQVKESSVGGGGVWIFSGTTH